MRPTSRSAASSFWRGYAASLRRTWSVKPPGVGVLLADPSPGLVHQEPVEDVGRLVDSGRDGLGGERGEPVGDMRVRLDAGFGPVPGVDQAFHMPAGDAHQLPEPVRGRGLGHLAQAEVDALGELHVEQTGAVAAGLPGFAGA